MKFESILNNQVDMAKVNLDSIKPWISKRITEILDHEDDVVIDYVFNQLEPQYPDPKEIQANLSGFFSLKNARIFLADLWKQLLDSMSEVNNGKIIKSVNDKIKDIPKVVTPNHFKVLANGSPKEHKFSTPDLKDNNHRYRRHSFTSSPSTSSHSTSSDSSSSDSSSSESNYRRKRRSPVRKFRSRDLVSRSPPSRRVRSSRYSHSRSGYPRLRYYSRRRSRSSYDRGYNERLNSRHKYSSKYAHHSSDRCSTGHTPYTRYSDYTDDKNYINLVSDNTSEEVSHSPSPRISQSPVTTSKDILPPGNMPDIACDKTESILISAKCPSSENNDLDEFEYCEELSEVNLLKSGEDISDKSSDKSAKLISIKRENKEDFEMLTSPSFRKQSNTSSKSSSSDYTVEYVEKSQLLEELDTSEDSEESLDSSSCVEWVTMEEYQNLHDSSSAESSSTSTSSGSASSSSSVSENEVVWIEEDHWDSYSEDFCRL